MEQNRQYQQQAHSDLRRAVARGKRRLLYVAPTGSGKTTVAKNLIKAAIEKACSAMFLAPRRVLVRQTSKKLQRHDIGHGVIMAGETGTSMTGVQVASVPTLYVRAVRNEKMPLPDARLVLVDEAHLARGGMMEELMRAYPGAIIIGFTASPCRTDGKGLGEVFDEIVLGPSVQKLIDDGYIVPPRYFVPSSPDLSKVRVSKGEYNGADLGRTMDQATLVGDVLANWLRLGKGRPTVIFTVNVAHSLHIETVFQQAGVRIAHMDANTPTDVRERIMADLRGGELEVVTNCFSGDTKFLSVEHGVSTLESAVGQEVTVRCADGVWRKGRVGWFGEQQTWKLRFRAVGRGRPHYREERATANHKWVLEDGRVTSALSVGDVLAPLPRERRLNHKAVIHGIIFGDGGLHTTNGGPRSSPRSYVSLRVCKKDAARDEICRYLTEAGFKARFPKHADGDAVFYLGRWPNLKELPKESDPEYVAGFIHGWWLADGVKGTPESTKTIHTVNAAARKWLLAHAPFAGLTVLSVRTWTDRKGVFANAKPLHQIRMKFGVKWRLESAMPAGAEQVFCVTEPATHTFTLASGLVTGNCDVLTLGWDEPCVSCCVLARPTKSLARYIQAVGRVLRPCPESGKTDCIVLDHGNCVAEHGLVEENHEWSLDKDRTVQERDLARKRERHEPKIITCGACRFVFKGQPACPLCQWRVPHGRKDIHTVDDDLAELRHKKRVKREWTGAQLDAFLGELNGYAQSRGFLSGWAAYAFKERMGSFPSPDHGDTSPRVPTPETLAWIKHYNIKRAKRREKQQRLAVAHVSP